MSFDEPDTTEEHERRIVRCRSCNAKIIWMMTRNLKHMPVDADTVEARKNATGRRAAALASGAQYISTDYLWPDPRFPGGYQGRLAGSMAASTSMSGFPRRSPSQRYHSLAAAVYRNPVKYRWRIMVCCSWMNYRSSSAARWK